MRWLLLVVGVLAVLVVGCKKDEEVPPGLAVDGDDAGESADGSAEADANKPPPDVAVPCEDDTACAEYGWVCDPLGGNCVPCLFDAQCEAGQACVGLECVDCPEGDCTAAPECVFDNDCPEGKICDAAGVCKVLVKCEDDAACADAKMVCDTDAGECVACLENAHCPEVYHCDEKHCVVDTCAKGQKGCVGAALASCNESGTGFSAPEPCPQQTTCVEDGLNATCEPLACLPGQLYCEGNVAIQCAVDGSLILEQTDCTTSGSYCAAGLCAGLPCKGEKCSDVAAGEDTDTPLLDDSETGFNVVIAGDGGVTLQAASLDLHVLWVSNSEEGTVSKIDTETGKELGRYAICKDPSRTAVNHHGDGWVACRSDNSTVAVIANFEVECFDKNTNGTIETSRDENDDGVISGAELLAKGEDECVVWSIEANASADNPTPGTIARALGVDVLQRGWVGLWDSKQLLLVEPDEGIIVDVVELPANPYGLVIDAQGVVWISGRGGGLLVRYNPDQGQLDSFKAHKDYSPYGIATDSFGRIWTPNLGAGGDKVWMFDPATEEWQSIKIPARGRGLVGDLDGKIYIACDQSNLVQVIDTIEMKATATVELGAGRFPLGMAIDAAGDLWTVNQKGESVTHIDRLGLEIIGEHKVGKGPYTYSDMTGTAFFGVPQPGWFRHRLAAKTDDGGVAPSVWSGFVLTTEMPEGAFVRFRVRGAATEKKLDAATWSPFAGPFPAQTFPADLSTLMSEPATFIELEVWLHPAPDGQLPTAKGLKVAYAAE